MIPPQAGLTDRELIDHLAAIAKTQAEIVKSQQSLIAGFQDVLRNQENWAIITVLQIARMVNLPVVDGVGPGPTLAALPSAVQAVVDERNRLRLRLPVEVPMKNLPTPQ